MAFIIEIGALLARRVRDEMRRALAVLLVAPGRPQIGRLADMGIGGDEAGLGHPVPPSGRRGLRTAGLFARIFLSPARRRPRFAALGKGLSAVARRLGGQRGGTRARGMPEK